MRAIFSRENIDEILLQERFNVTSFERPSSPLISSRQLLDALRSVKFLYELSPRNDVKLLQCITLRDNKKGTTVCF